MHVILNLIKTKNLQPNFSPQEMLSEPQVQPRVREPCDARVVSLHPDHAPLQHPEEPAAGCGCRPYRGNHAHPARCVLSENYNIVTVFFTIASNRTRVCLCTLFWVIPRIYLEKVTCTSMIHLYAFCLPKPSRVSNVFINVGNVVYICSCVIINS